MSKLTHPALKRWRADPAAFVETVLINPGPGFGAGKPFVLLEAERSFLKHALALGPNGRLLYPELVYSAPKKSGKSMFGALLVITVVVLFGDRFAEAYCVANDLEQAQGRVFEMCRQVIEASPLLRREAKISADKITFLATGATITALACNYASAAGGHPTIAVFDELWGYTSERSRRLWDELVPVPTRDISCRLVVSHAGFTGESVLLEELHKRGQSQPAVGPSLHAGDGLLMAWHTDLVAPWQDEAWLELMRRSLRPHQYLRMVENKFAAAESSFIDLAAWDACVDPLARPVLADKNLPIWVGVDASFKHDCTAIVAVTYGEGRVRLIAHRVFVPTPGQPIDFELAVEATLLDLAKRFAVRKILFDPWQMQAVAQRLTNKHGLPIKEFTQTTGHLTEASQGLYELIQGRNLVLYPDAPMRLAASRAIALETSRGWRIAKEKQSHRIDVIVALAMSAHAAVKSVSEFTEPPFVVPFVYSQPRGAVPGASPMLAAGSVAAPDIVGVPGGPPPSSYLVGNTAAIASPPSTSVPAPSRPPSSAPKGNPEGWRVGPPTEPWRRFSHLYW